MMLHKWSMAKTTKAFWDISNCKLTNINKSVAEWGTGVLTGNEWS